MSSRRMLDALASVHEQDIDGRSSDGGSAGQYRADPGEMHLPNVVAGMEEPCQQTCVGVEARDIRPLMEVVTEAGQRQILSDRRSVVLLGNDVVNLEGQSVEPLREPPVFAGVFGAVPDQTFQRLVQRVTRLESVGSAKAQRALAWIRLRKLPTRR